MTPFEIGLLGCALMVVMLASSMPVGFVMAVVGLIGFAQIVSAPAALSMVVSDLYSTFTSASLTVIPLFVFMGQIAFHAEIGRAHV